MHLDGLNNILKQIQRNQLKSALTAKRKAAAKKGAQTKEEKRKSAMNIGPQEPSRRSLRLRKQTVGFNPRCVLKRPQKKKPKKRSACAQSAVVPASNPFNFDSLLKSLALESNFNKRKKRINGILEYSKTHVLSNKQLIAVVTFPYYNSHRYMNGGTLTNHEMNNIANRHGKKYPKFKTAWNAYKYENGGTCAMQM